VLEDSLASSSPSPLETRAAALVPLRASHTRVGLAHAVCRLVTDSAALACRIDALSDAGHGTPPTLETLGRRNRYDRLDLDDPSEDFGTDAAVAGVAAVVPDPGRDVTWVVIPLVANRRPIGGLRVVLEGTTGPSTPELGCLHHIGSSLALGLSAAEHREESERVSRRLQESLLPSALPEAPWFEAAACYVPATAGMHVGGDWYDAQLVSADELAFSVGDIAGHGVEAAARMGEVRSAIAALRLLSRAPDELVALLHRHCEPAGYFATAVCARVDPNGSFRWSSAGHLPPLVAHASGGATLLRGHRSPRSAPESRAPSHSIVTTSSRETPCSCTPTGSSSVGTRRWTRAWRSSSQPSAARSRSPKRVQTGSSTRCSVTARLRGRRPTTSP
jgi:hypothetical protein